MILAGWFICEMHTTYATHGTGHRDLVGAGVAQRLCNGLPCNDMGFNYRWGRCKNRPSQTLNDLAVDGTLNTTNQPTGSRPVLMYNVSLLQQPLIQGNRCINHCVFNVSRKENTPVTNVCVSYTV